MAIEVAKVELKNVSDASGLAACIDAGQFTADEVVAVIGKTEGNGGVNDFTRILADQAFRAVLAERGSRDTSALAQIPMVWSGGCDGVITPHATIFAQTEETGPADESRLVIGTAISAELLPEDIGRVAMVEKVADAVRAAMDDAGIDNPADVHYVQTKTPLLTIESVADAASRGQSVACEVHDSMGVSNGTTALGIGVALGEIAMPTDTQICKDLDLYSAVSSCSSGVELTQAQIVLLGNRAGAGGRFAIGHSVMKDALDMDGIYDGIRSAGLDLPERARAEDLGGRPSQRFHQMRGRPPRPTARTPPNHARRFRRPSSPSFQGRGWWRRGRSHRRCGGFCVGRRHAPRPPWRRSGHRHCG